MASLNQLLEQLRVHLEADDLAERVARLDLEQVRAMAKPIIASAHDVTNQIEARRSAIIKLNRVWMEIGPKGRNPQPDKWAAINAQALPKARQLYQESQKEVTGMLPAITKVLDSMKKLKLDARSKRAQDRYRDARYWLAKFKKDPPTDVSSIEDSYPLVDRWQRMMSNFTTMGLAVEAILQEAETSEA